MWLKPTLAERTSEILMASNGKPVLQLQHVDAYYGQIHALRDVSLEVREGQITSLLGGNASGKSTTLKTILGLVKPSGGTITYEGERIDGLTTAELVERGISMVPENRRVFTRMSVRENLEMGAYLRTDQKAIEQDISQCCFLFPRLEERMSQISGTLSGGEQQMLAMARALMSKPKLLLMDEPSMGLAPLLVQQIFDIIVDINKLGTTIFVVEQNANMALSIADYGYVLQTGKIVLSDTAENLLENKMMREAYLGEM